MVTFAEAKKNIFAHGLHIGNFGEKEKVSYALIDMLLVVVAKHGCYALSCATSETMALELIKTDFSRAYTVTGQ